MENMLFLQSQMAVDEYLNISTLDIARQNSKD